MLSCHFLIHLCLNKLAWAEPQRIVESGQPPHFVDEVEADAEELEVVWVGRDLLVGGRAGPDFLLLARNHRAQFGCEACGKWPKRLQTNVRVTIEEQQVVVKFLTKRVQQEGGQSIRTNRKCTCLGGTISAARNSRAACASLDSRISVQRAFVCRSELPKTSSASTTIDSYLSAGILSQSSPPCGK